jgi:hypothetical protein
MSEENADSERLEFWEARLADGSILDSLKVFPEQAKKFFGAQAVAHGNLLHLGIILGAWQILSTPPGRLSSGMDELTEAQLHESLEALPSEIRSTAKEFLSPANHEKRVIQLARHIVKEATGVDPG